MLLFIIFIVLLILVFLIHLLLKLKKEIKDITKYLEKISYDEMYDEIIIFSKDKDLANLLLVLNENISHQKKINEDILKREKMLTNSILNISNSIKTPFTSIMSYIRLIKKHGLNEEQNEYYNLIIHKESYFKNLIQGFFEIASLDAKTELPFIEKINLENFLLTWLVENSESLKKANIIPKFDMFTRNSFVFGDTNMLKRVLQNLFTNTSKYSNENIFISTSGFNKNDIKLIIQNDLCGAGPVDTETIFKKFYTDDVSDIKENTGLGLSISKILMEQMGGTITANSDTNSFEILLTFNTMDCGYFSN